MNQFFGGGRYILGLKFRGVLSFIKFDIFLHPFLPFYDFLPQLLSKIKIVLILFPPPLPKYETLYIPAKIANCNT